MSVLLAFVTILVVVITVFAVTFSIKKRDSLAEIEEDKTPIYTENCGAYLYCSSFLRQAFIRKPLARVTLYDDFMVVSFAKKLGRGKFVLKLKEVEKVEIKKMASAQEGLHVYYQQEGKSDYMILLSNDLGRLQAKIRSQ